MKIGETLIQQGVISENDLQIARFEQKRAGGRLGAIMIRLKMATEIQIAQALSKQLEIPYLDLTEQPLDPQAIVLIPKQYALKNICIAFRLENKMLDVAISNPLSLTVIHDIEFATGYRINLYLAITSKIVEAIEKGYSNMALVAPKSDDRQVVSEDQDCQFQEAGCQSESSDQEESETDYFENSTESNVEDPNTTGPIAKFVDSILEEALAAHASDVHIEASETGTIIRHRLDGLLKEVAKLPKWAHKGLISRLKIMARLDIAETRLPQDGRMQIRSKDGRKIDLRLSSLRILYGEKIVLRILDHSKGIPAIETLGFSSRDLQQIRHLLKHQHGMILAVGPTGSGKSTTLASALASIKSVTTNIVTIEDPIEYEIAGINQTQIHEKIKLTFANSLRSILRQDPDVIFVGEIRDHETARIALQAAQTGHLVLSTLHTEDAPSMVTRLLDMGVEPYIVGSALLGVVGQRLVRRLCLNCRTQYIPRPEVLQALNIPANESSRWPLYRAVGCSECHQTGYRGRIAIYEVMNVNDRIARMISERAGEDAIRDAALEAGMTTLGEDGLAKVKAGITSPDELLRVVTEVRELRTLCPDCGAIVKADFTACPNCGRRLGGGCVKCGRIQKPAWKYCPYCANCNSQRAFGTVEEMLSTTIDELTDAVRRAYEVINRSEKMLSTNDELPEASSQ